MLHTLYAKCCIYAHNNVVCVALLLVQLFLFIPEPRRKRTEMMFCSK